MSYTNEIQDALMADARERRYPISVNFELLPVCNLDCRMCYIRSTPEEVRAKGGLKSVEEWLGLAKEMQESDTLFILLTGGEVFLYPEFRCLYESLYDMGYAITINSNATLIDEEVVAYLAERPPKCVSISLYGSNDQIYQEICGAGGMFTRVDKAISLLLEHGIQIECKTVVTPINRHDIDACRSYARKRGIPYEVANYAYPPIRKEKVTEAFRLSPEEAALFRIEDNWKHGKLEDNLQAIRDYLAKYEACKSMSGSEICGLHCSAASSSCWINWEGRMISCAMLPEPYTEPFKEGFERAWEGLKEKCDQLRMSSKCSHCDKRTICTVCPAGNYTETGSYELSSPFHCEMTESILQNLTDLLAKYNGTC